jgi:hypothetical protein
MFGKAEVLFLLLTVGGMDSKDNRKHNSPLILVLAPSQLPRMIHIGANRRLRCG